MPRVEFEPTIPVFERPKTVHALDSMATVIGWNICLPPPKLTDVLLSINLQNNETYA
jgi:hypothetical protein